MERKITKKTSTPLYDYGGIFLLLVFQLPCIFFLFISFYSEDTLIFLYLIPLYFFIYYSFRASIIGIRYFISVEECFYEDKKLHYTKTLFQKWIIRRFSVPILEVESIEERGRKILKGGNSINNPLYYIYYFKIYERIHIQMKNGEKYYIWNHVQKPSLRSLYDNSADSDEEFLESFYKLQVMFEEGKKDANFQNRLKEWERIYLGEIEGRYAMVLQEMLQEEKVFLIQTENHFTVNVGEEAIQHLGMFQARKFKEMDFYKFYLDYLSNKEYENSRVRVADNERDFKEVSMKQLKEDINKLRDEK